MDVSSKGKYPSNKLSNFAGHRFVLDGVTCNSMEGFLQALKFENPAMQAEVCSKVGIAAKRSGSKKRWQRSQTLWWQGQKMGRLSDAYQDLLNRAYDEMFNQSEGFRKALKAAGPAVFTHSIGRNKPNETVLTTREFVGQLNRQRKRL